MLVITLSDIENKNKYNTEIELNHHIYGKYIVNKFYDLIYLNLKTKEFIKLDNYKLFITNDIEKPFDIYSKYSNKFILCNPNNMYVITINDIPTTLYKYNMILSSVFLEYFQNNNTLENIKKISTDHIDDNHKNDLISNLQFLNFSENCKKGQEKSIRKIKEKGGRNGKKIMLTYLNKETKEYGDLKSFQSIGALVNFMINNELCIPTSTYDVLSKYFREIIDDDKSRISYNKKQYSAYEITSNNFINEIWKNIPENLYTIDTDRKYQISNYGRMKNLDGLIMNPTLVRNKKYHNVSLNSKKYNIHCLLYMSFYPESIQDILDKKMDVCHKDDVPLCRTKDDQLYHRNYLEDLYLNTHSNNMKDFHKNKHIINEIIDDKDDILYENTELLYKILN